MQATLTRKCHWEILNILKVTSWHGAIAAQREWKSKKVLHDSWVKPTPALIPGSFWWKRGTWHQDNRLSKATGRRGHLCWHMSLKTLQLHLLAHENITQSKTRRYFPLNWGNLCSTTYAYVSFLNTYKTVVYLQKKLFYKKRKQLILFLHLDKILSHTEFDCI